VTMKLAEAVAGVPAESVTFKVNWKVPVAVGVPEMVALGLAEVSVRPAGRVEDAATIQV
jgi:hypothetical protein